MSRGEEEKGTGYFSIEALMAAIVEGRRAENSTRTAGRLRLPRH